MLCMLINSTYNQKYRKLHFTANGVRMNSLTLENCKSVFNSAIYDLLVAGDIGLLEHLLSGNSI